MRAGRVQLEHLGHSARWPFLIDDRSSLIALAYPYLPTVGLVSLLSTSFHPTLLHSTLSIIIINYHRARQSHISTFSTQSYPLPASFLSLFLLFSPSIAMSLPRLGVDLDSDHEEETNYLSKPKTSSHEHAAGNEIDVGDGLSEFPTYEDYLDSQILPEDMKYLEVSLSLGLDKLFASAILLRSNDYSKQAH